MTIFPEEKSGGLFGSPGALDRISIGLSGLGRGLMDLSSGRPVDMSPYTDAIRQHKEQQKRNETFEKVRKELFGDEQAHLDDPTRPNTGGASPVAMTQNVSSPYEMPTSGGSYLDGMDPQMVGLLKAQFASDPNAAIRTAIDWKSRQGVSPEARSAIGKLTEDYRSGLIDKETFLDARRKALQTNGGITIGPDGTVQIGGPGNVARLSEGQSKILNLGTRMQNADTAVTEAIEKMGGEPGLVETFASQAGVLGNFFKSDEYQSYEAAARDWIAALLRLDSGAAVPDTEFFRYFGQYFPQPGDSAQALQQKARARASAVGAIQKASGGLLQPNEAQPSQADSDRRVINGKTYVKRGGRVYEVMQ